MKKKLVTLLAALMLVGATTTAFAAPSPEINSPEIDSPGASDDFEAVVEGNVDISDIDNLTAEDLAALVVPAGNIEGAEVVSVTALDAATLKDAAALLEKGTIAAAMDIEVAEVPATLIFKGLESIKAGDSVIVLHQLADKSWEVIPAVASEDGAVKATFNSLSPVVIVKDAELVETEEPGTDEPGTEEPGTDEPGTEEPGTDEPGTEEPGTEEPGTDAPTSPVTGATVVLPMIAIAGLAGAAVCGKKVNK